MTNIKGLYQRGTHIAVQSGFLRDHHGIYYGYNKVIHLNGKTDNLLTKGPLEKTTLEEFTNGCTVFEVEHENPPPLPWGKVIERAEKALREPHKWAYDLFLNNCEHFANWCAIGKKESDQITRLVLIGPGGLAISRLFEWGEGNG